MATNKNAQLRYLILDECFSNFNRKYAIEDLIEKVEEKLSEHFAEEITISLRQIREDIKFMRSIDGFDAPIVTYRDGKAGYYRYDDSDENKDYSIRKKPLTKSEIETLQETILALSRSRNVEESLNLDSVLTRLENEFGIKRPERQIISFEENEYLKGLEHLNPLYNYILNRQVLSVQYKRFGEDESRVFTISPYYLKQYNNRWFFYGWNHENNTLYNLPIDRIESFEKADTAYIDENIDFKEYFDEIIGVTNFEDRAEEKILLKFSESRYPYIVSKPIHHSQKKNDERHEIELKLKTNRELISMLLSFGKDVRVLQPESLKNELKGILMEMNKNYEL